jgi:hypothetical protein
MSVHLTYTIDRDSPDPDPDWAAMGRSELHYDVFTGGFGFKIGDADFSSMDRKWVPILDWAIALRGIVVDLGPRDEDFFEFTESNERIWFRRFGNEVRISATYVDDVATVDYVKLRTAAEKFMDDLSVKLLDAHPELGRNEYFTSRAGGDNSE